MIAAKLGPIPPHDLVRDLLVRDEHSALLSWTISKDELFASSMVGEQGKIDPSRRVSRSLRLTSEMQPWRSIIKNRLYERLPEIFAGAGLRPFDISQIELELVSYQHGSHFRVHKDTITLGKTSAHDRILTGVYYYYWEPKRFSGGNMRIYPFGFRDGDESHFVEIEPRQNALLVFPSWAMHAVTPVTCPDDDPRSARFAINCWLHKRRTL